MNRLKHAFKSTMIAGLLLAILVALYSSVPAIILESWQPLIEGLKLWAICIVIIFGIFLIAPLQLGKRNLK